MRILIDFSQIPTDRTGVGVYAENLVRSIKSELAVEDVLFLLVQKDEWRAQELVLDASNIVVITLPFILLRKRILLLFFEQIFLPILLAIRKVQVVHSLHYTHPLVSPCPRIVTIHDLTFLLRPRLHTLGRRLLFPFFVKRAIKHAEGLIFVSKVTSSDCDSVIPGPPSNLRKVIPLGTDPSSFIIDDASAQSVLAALSIESKFILFLGTIEPRKNLLRLVRAFEQIADRHPLLLLVLAGKPGWDFDEVFSAIQSSKYRNRIRCLGFITNVQKNALLARCEALVYPSLYEGFGLPVLEAMAAGAPVITSNVSSLPEVAEHAAVLIDPLSVEEIAGAISSLLSDDQKRMELRNLGRKRATQFSWQTVASQTLELYRAVSKK